MNDHALQRFWDELRQTGGSTIDPRTGDLPPRRGYMVGQAHHDCQYPAYLFWCCKDALLAKFVQQYRAQLLMPNAYVGVWEHKGAVYLEVSHCYTNLKDALRVGELRKQIAIWDLANKKEILL